MRSVQVSGGGASSGRSRRTGCGSNVKITAGPLNAPSMVDQPLDQLGVAAMNAVEIPDRDGATVGVRRGCRSNWRMSFTVSTVRLFRRSVACRRGDRAGLVLPKGGGQVVDQVTRDQAHLAQLSGRQVASETM